MDQYGIIFIILAGVAKSFLLPAVSSAIIKSRNMEALQHPCVIQWLESVKKATKDVYVCRINEVLEK